MNKLSLDNSSRNSYKTERFCTALDHNIVLLIETNSEGSEHKTCENINSCKKKQKCRYLMPDKNSG